MRKKQQGFTIIEVALVLAIAGLIFLVVFLAVPALQRNQRDDARKRDVSNIVEAVTNYTSSNNALPPATAPWLQGSTVAAASLSPFLSNLSGNVEYVNVIDLPGTLSWPPTTATTAHSGSTASSDPAINQIVIYRNARCGASTSAVPQAGTSRQAAVVVMTEAGNGTPYCQDAS